ncbi:hypothetical protein A3Q56_05043 [Intoshia linei]|uniref:MABP domain-containing protein n=1 Tax=Intoshia linei TaxID=1819745 RepID=A0A177B0U0_9BILA|nr:hypothetical protein A3Q56_05043 [Intoshia linei]
MKKSSSITDYFLVSGIDNVNAPRLSEFDTSFCYKRAISEIVIFDKSNETIKDGYTLVDKTISGYDANLSNEMFGSRKIYLAYKNEPTHEPIIDMGIYTENSTPPGDDVKIIYTTPKRYAANIIDNDRKRSYITYKKKSYSSEYDLSQHEKPFQFSSKSCYSDSSNFHVITDIVIILPDKGEQLPQTYTMINRNIKNSLFQPKMFICYRRTVGKSNLLSFTPDILIKFPQNNFDSIPYGVSRFIHPMGNFY